MKKLYILILTILFCSFTIYGQFSNSIDGKNKTYGIIGNNVFKIDTSGHTVWVKDFSGNIVSSATTNQLVGSAIVGSAIYLSVFQGNIQTIPPFNYYGSVIKLDTSGNVIWVKSNIVSTSGDYSVFGIYPSVTGGVWMLDVFSPGITHLGSAQYFDSSGVMGTSVDFYFFHNTIIKGMYVLPDSNFFVCVNSEPTAGSGQYPVPAINMYDRTGNYIWQYSYQVNLGTGLNVFAEHTATFDSLNNIYMICEYTSSSVNGFVGIKVDSSGNVITGKFWSGLPASTSGELLIYKNHEVIWRRNGSDVVFDTLFNNPCLPGQNITITAFNNSLPAGHTQYYSPTSFTLVNGVPFTIHNNSFPDYCTILSSEDKINNRPFVDLFPNPSVGTLKIKTNFLTQYKLTITDLYGRVFYQKQSDQNELNLDISLLNDGIYMLSLSNESFSIANKLVLEKN